MSEFLNDAFTMPVLPATVLLILVCAYWLFVMVGALDFELFDIDLDVDTQIDVEHSLLSIGLVPLRFLNIGQVPLMLWVSLFGLSWWVFSLIVDEWASGGSVLRMAQSVALAFALSLILTKALTQPMRGWFHQIEPRSAGDLIGGTCQITGETTATYGQARYETGAAPLLLQVRSRDETLGRGDVAEILDYDPVARVYIVRKETADTPVVSGGDIPS